MNKRDVVKGIGTGIVTLTSRPVFANHCTLSGHMSGNLSMAPNHQVDCSAFEVVKEPSFWIANKKAWPVDRRISVDDLFNNLIVGNGERAGYWLKYGTALEKALVAHALTILHPNINYDQTIEDLANFLSIADTIEKENLFLELLESRYDGLGDSPVLELDL